MHDLANMNFSDLFMYLVAANAASFKTEQHITEVYSTIPENTV